MGETRLPAPVPRLLDGGVYCDISLNEIERYLCSEGEIDHPFSAVIVDDKEQELDMD